MCQHPLENIQHFIAECPEYQVYREYAKLELFVKFIQLLKIICEQQQIQNVVKIYDHSFVSQFNLDDNKILNHQSFTDLVLGIVPFTIDYICDDSNVVIQFNKQNQQLAHQMFVEIICKMLFRMVLY